MHKYSDEEKAFLKASVKGRSYKEITEMFNRRFNLSLLESSVMSTCYRYGYKNGLDTRIYEGNKSTQFKPGHIPFNKGKKGEYAKGSEKTWFKNGNLPKNYKPVGSERITRDGYMEIKIEDPNKWKMKHVVEWEKINGPVPKGHVIIFADKDKMNFSIDNLLLVSRRELVVMNTRGLVYTSGNMTYTGKIIADLYLEISDRTKTGGKE